MSLKEIVMPQLGESVTEGTINNWYVKEGEMVKKYDPIAEVLSDKVTAEIPSLFTGKISKIIAPEGEAVPVGELICYIEAVENEDEKMNDKEKNRIKANCQPKQSKPRFSPAVLKLAQEHNINLDEVKGTGKGGRITRKDVLVYIEEKKLQPERKQANVQTDRKTGQ